MRDPVCIIGTGVAALALLREYRQREPEHPVLVLSDGSGDYCYKPQLSAAFAAARTPAGLVTESAAHWSERYRARLLPQASPRIDAARRCITTAEGEVHYQALVLATGAVGRVPPLRGNVVDRVARIDTWSEFARNHEALRHARCVAVIGAGLIGTELADDLARAGKRVELIDTGPYPLHGRIPASLGARLVARFAADGIRLHPRRRAIRIDAGPGDRLRLTLEDARLLDVDAVVSATGVAPDLGPARHIGLACRTGIVIDSAIRTSIPHLHAIGDVAEDAGGWQPCVARANDHARVLAARLTGGNDRLAPTWHPVRVKTPLCPLLYLDPGSEGTQWRSIEHGRDSIEMRCHDARGRLVGFALLGDATARRAELLALMTHEETDDDRSPA